MGELLGDVVAALVVGAVTTFAIVRYQRSLERPGGRDGLGGIADGLGAMINVFDPGQARAREQIRHEANKGPVTSSPDDDDDDRIRLVTNPDGTPRAVRIRRDR